jgi:glycine/D-amino acid oxidase-like deaminating enzyme
MHLKAKSTPFAAVAGPISAGGAYHPVGFWQETVTIKPGDPLDGDIACDVAIVGGGFTGLSTAYELKKAAPGLNVVLIERAFVGYGASGRNGGFVMPLIGWDLHDVTRRLGEEGARDAYRLMHDAVAHTIRTIRDNGISCDIEQTGYLLLATCPARQGRLREESDLARRLGFEPRWLEGAALREHIRSGAFTAGVFDPHPAVVNPAKLVRGLKSLAENAGVLIHEQTPLVELIDAEPVLLRTPRGTLRAKQVVLAVNGYGGTLGFLRSRIHPVHTYIVLTEPLSGADLDAIGWGARRTSLETDRNFIHYFRLTADNRILFGGEDATLYYGGKLLDEHPPTFRRLEARFREYFPALGHVRFTHRWGGVLAVTLDMLPTFGVDGRHGTIFHAAGYSGHGVALGNYAGKILAPHILRQAGLGISSEDVPTPFFFNRKPMATPPDPLRYVGLQVYRMALHAQDWWQRA